MVTSPTNAQLNVLGYQNCWHRLEEAKGKPCDLIFLGASTVEYFNTVAPKVWEKEYAAQHPLNLGIEGDKTQDLLWRLDHMDLRGLRPKVVLLFIGLNNYADSSEQIASDEAKVIDKIRHLFPQSKVMVTGLIPTYRTASTYQATNVLLQKLADNRHVFYIDLATPMAKGGNYSQYLREDHYHLNAMGYALWAQQMQPVFNLR